MSDKRRKRRRQNRQRKATAFAGRLRPKARPEATRPEGTTTPSPGVHTVASADLAAGPHVVVAFASNGQIHEQALGSMQAMIRDTRRAGSVEMWWQRADTDAHCRNLLVERFLADNAKTHLAFVGADIVAPQRGLDLLLETNEPLVCGPAPICHRREGAGATRHAPFDLTTDVMDVTVPALRGSPIDPHDARIRYHRRQPGELPDTLFACDATSLSFCLIAREVLERMTPPWFHVVDVPHQPTIDAEVYFLRKAGQLGYHPTVHPEAWCDHVMPVDLTHIEQLMVPPLPGPRWNRTASGETPRTLVIACTARRWLDFRTAEILITWQEEPGNRIGVRLIDAHDVGSALARFLHDPQAGDRSWERFMLLGPDMIPTRDLVHQLGSIDAPIVSTLNRALIDGEIAYTFRRPDPATGQVEHPIRLSLNHITGPFKAHTADLACSVIRRDTCRHVAEALQFAAGQADPARAFNERFCDLVREATGCDPLIAPVCVERRADAGLLGLLRLKHKVYSEHQVRDDNHRPVCV
ncbi:MAG: hypothetical protein JSV19_13850 [Phycisphaerales bacterium]|nr:MAG: hypothetical protein JSV19_13850 [Phycisphaerales bacterium]